MPQRVRKQHRRAIIFAIWIRDKALNSLAIVVCLLGRALPDGSCNMLLFKRPRVATSLAWLLLTLQIVEVALVAVVAAETIKSDDGSPPLVPEVEPSKPTDITQNQPTYLVRVSVDREDCKYREGDQLRVSVVAEEDCYLYLLYQQADGSSHQIFPNSVQKVSHVKAKQTVVVPAADDLFRWVISAPFGDEYIKAIASKKPLASLDDPSLRAKRFNAVDVSQLRTAAKDLKGDEETNPKMWAEDEVKIHTSIRSDDQSDSDAKRFGVFFGVSKYEFNDAAKEIFEGKWEPNLAYCRNDALALQSLMHSMGKLDDSRAFADDQATRRQMEESITQWLPSVSKPGDTVIIFFSGHGGQTKDGFNVAGDPQDETDGLDEWLLTHDYVDGPIFMGLTKQKAEGRLPSQFDARLEQLTAIVRASQSAEAAESALVRATGVTDDLFGHWLQRLAGRRILVILDSCHSGGMANDEKSLDATRLPAFDFLDGELNRLKDLGQPESVLLAACNYNKSTLAARMTDRDLDRLRAIGKGAKDDWNTTEQYSLFSFYLVQGLIAGPRPLNVDEMFSSCRTGMKDYLENLNDVQRRNNAPEISRYEPVLVKYTERPILIKP
jgi:hypothetical protein